MQSGVSELAPRVDIHAIGRQCFKHLIRVASDKRLPLTSSTSYVLKYPWAILVGNLKPRSVRYSSKPSCPFPAANHIMNSLPSLSNGRIRCPWKATPLCLVHRLRHFSAIRIPRGPERVYLHDSYHDWATIEPRMSFRTGPISAWEW